MDHIKKFENWSNELINEAKSTNGIILKDLQGLKKNLDKTKESFIEFINKLENLHWNANSEEEKKKLERLKDVFRGNVYFTFKETLNYLDDFEGRLK